MFILDKGIERKVVLRSKYLPGIAMLILMASRSFFLCLAISSSIFSIFSGLRAHKQPFLALPFNFGVSTLAKHLLRDRLCLTEF
jgi:hypothetical protein